MPYRYVSDRVREEDIAFSDRIPDSHRMLLLLLQCDNTCGCAEADVSGAVVEACASICWLCLILALYEG